MADLPKIARVGDRIQCDVRQPWPQTYTMHLQTKAAAAFANELLADPELGWRLVVATPQQPNPCKLTECKDMPRCEHCAAMGLNDPAGVKELPAALFDGYAVYQALSERAKARTSPENVADTLDALVKVMRAAGVAPSPAPSKRVLPHPGSPEASAMMDSVLAEYNWPANTKNAARAGWEAAQRWLATSGVRVEGGTSNG